MDVRIFLTTKLEGDVLIKSVLDAWKGGEESTVWSESFWLQQNGLFYNGSAIDCKDEIVDTIIYKKF